MTVAVVRSTCPSSATATSALRTLREDLAQLGVVFVLVYVVNPHMSLKIIRSGILVLSIWTERTHVARRLVNQAMSNHFIFPLKPFSTFCSWAAPNGTEV